MTLPDSKAGRLWLHSIKRTKSAEMQLPQVVRWKRYIPIVQCRKQNSLGHSYTISLLGTHVVKLLKPYVTLDVGLLLTALMIHDLGEAIRFGAGEDVRWHQKTCGRDLEEYEFFTAHFSDLPPETFSEYQKAFLLQFASEGKDASCFPAADRAIIADLQKNNALEIAAFLAIERWDYVLYGLGNYEEQGTPLLLLEVLNSHMATLDKLVAQLPGFGEEIWTPEIRSWCAELVASNPQNLERAKELLRG